jgi:single-strand DNA-binding protein
VQTEEKKHLLQSLKKLKNYLSKGEDIMNRVIILGRLVADPEIRYTQNNAAMTRFKIAVNRQYKQEGQPDADFFQITAWGKTAEFISKYFTKGQQILVEGYLRNNSWTDQQGNKRYSDDIHADKVYFADSKRDKVDDTGERYSAVSAYQDPQADEDLPF